VVPVDFEFVGDKGDKIITIPYELLKQFGCCCGGTVKIIRHNRNVPQFHYDTGEFFTLGF
jgi:hypothetical protein